MISNKWREGSSRVLGHRMESTSTGSPKLSTALSSSPFQTCFAGVSRHQALSSRGKTNIRRLSSHVFPITAVLILNLMS